MNNTGALAAVAGIIAGILTVAIVAVLVGRQSQTSSVINASGSALANVIKQAVAPVSGGNTFGSG